MIHYFDNCATTRVDDQVFAQLQHYATTQYYNPSARSSYSLQVANEIASSREKIAKLLGVSADEIVFTSGGTESNNLAITGCLRAKRGNIVVTASEHSAVYNAVMHLKDRGYEIRIANTLPDGHIDIFDFFGKVDSDTQLACFMHVNNETGAINDVAQLNALIKLHSPRTITFCDGVQAVGKIPVNIRAIGVDMYSFSGHKFHASKGTGGLFVKKAIKLSPLVQGGGQEKGVRSGTEYVGGIVTLSTALSIAISNLSQNNTNFLTYKQIVRDALSEIPNWKENCTQNCSPAIMSLAFADIKGEVLLHMLEQFDIIVGTGSACSSKNKQSRVAKAIGLDSNYSEGVLRISFSKYNTLDEVQLLAEKLAYCVKSLRKTMLG